jgi:TrmH family RNA methyltransferase
LGSLLDIRVILVEPEHEGNIGAIARLMMNFGLGELFIVHPKVQLGDETRAYASHAQEIITEAVIVNDLKTALAGVSYSIGTTAISAKRSGNLLRTTITPEEVAKILALIKGKVALLFGRESKGLSNKELTTCDIIVTIPSNPHYKTLNIAAASALIFYELWKSKNKYQRGYIEEANLETRKRLIDLFDTLLERNVLPSYKKRLTRTAFKNIIARAYISKREATLIIGALRQTLEKITSSVKGG